MNFQSFAGENRNRIFVAGLALYFLLVTTGLFSEADGPLFALIYSLLFSWMIPFFLLAVATVQDAPGQSYHWWYIGFSTLALLMLVNQFRSADFWLRSRNFGRVHHLAAGAIGAAAFAFMVSLSGFYPQAGSRPFYLVFPLIVMMILAAMAFFESIDRPEERQFLKWTIYASLGFGLTVVLAQLYVADASLLASEYGKGIILADRAYNKIFLLGYPRLTGTSLSSNAFGLTMFLLLALQLNLNRESIGKAYLFFVVAGMVVALLSLSKALILLFFASLLLIMICYFRRTLLPVAVIAGSFAIFLLSNPELLQDALQAFRAKSLFNHFDTNIRMVAWQAILSEFGWLHWLFGTGLSHWPIFFEEHIGRAIADPHSFIFSIPGTYGLPGVIFYGWLVWLLIGQVRERQGDDRFLPLFLLAIIIGKDLVSIPYVLGNTPVTFLIWLLLVMVVGQEKRTGRSA